MADYLKDVKAESSPAAEDDHYEEPDETQDDLDAEGPEGDEGEGKGRTLENVHRELSRKYDKLSHDVFTALNQLAEGQAAMQNAITGFVAQPGKNTGNTLDDMSVAELRQLRVQVQAENPDKLEDLDAYITERVVEERVSSQLNQFQQTTAISQQRQNANTQATERYPELKVEGSEFRQAVNDRLNDLGEDWVKNNPRAVLDAANDVAFELGIQPQRGGRSERMRGRVAGARTGKATAKPDPIDEHLPVNDAQIDSISSRLADALPPGKSFDKSRIKENMKAYRDNTHFFLKG